MSQEQVAETRATNLDFLFDVGNKAVENVEKLAALNAQAIRSTLEDWFDLAQKSLSTNEPQE
ncbi:phasin family protein [Paraburkholderia azotifigens]|uniref:phasin family protein n=1 Tax=Paraburkholderia azotifigens TaxID=2057004 RepID=UPI00316B8DF0